MFDVKESESEMFIDTLKMVKEYMRGVMKI
jgi:hypothetical protein